MNQTSKPHRVPRGFETGGPLSGEVTTIYAAITNTDTTEGRGSRFDHSYYLTEQDAIMGASGIGVMGQAGEVEPRTALRLEGDKYLLLSDPVSISSPKKGELRQQALAKLTEAERAALLG